MPGRRSGIGFRGGAAESHIEKVFPLETPADSSPLLRSRTAVWALQGWSGDPSGVGFLNMSTGSLPGMVARRRHPGDFRRLPRRWNGPAVFIDRRPAELRSLNESARVSHLKDEGLTPVERAVTSSWVIPDWTCGLSRSVAL